MAARRSVNREAANDTDLFRVETIEALARIEERLEIILPAAAAHRDKLDQRLSDLERTSVSRTDCAKERAACPARQRTNGKVRTGVSVAGWTSVFVAFFKAIEFIAQK